MSNDPTWTQPALFIVPDTHARRTDPGTSWAAADSVKPFVMRAVHRAALELLSERSDCHDGLWSRYLSMRYEQDWPRCSVSGFRTRVSELVAAGLAADSGHRIVLASGRQAVVWHLTMRGAQTAGDG